MMEAKDILQLSYWVHGRASLADVESVDRIGLVDNERFTEQARRAFVLYWTWSTFRHSGRADWLQERCYRAHGMDGLKRRIARAHRLMARVLGCPVEKLTGGKL